MRTFHYDLFPQVWVDKNGDAVLVQSEQTVKYRLDFALINYGDYVSSLNDPKHPYLKIGIEVDGHDFHEKTKAQVKRDKERDRFLTIKGWHLLHFSGSEVFNDPFYCVEELDKLLNSISSLTINGVILAP